MNRRLAWSACFTSLTAVTILAGSLLLSLAEPVHAWPKGGGPGGGGGGPPADLIPLKIILMAGRSNLAGYGENSDLDLLAPELIAPQTDVLAYTGTVPHTSVGEWWELQPGLGDGTTLSDRFGPELTFGRTLANARSDDNIALIKARGAGGTLAVDFDPVSEGPSWVVFVDTVNNALAALDPSIYEPEIVGMVWVQGGDAGDEDQALAFEENLTNFIQAVRDEFGKPNLPFIITQLHHAAERPFGLEVYQANINVSQNVPNTGLVETDDLSTISETNWHFDAAGQLELGVRLANEILAIPPTSVDSVSYQIVSMRKKQDLVVSIQISDVEMGPVPFTSVSATLLHDSGSTWDAAGITDASGTAVLTLSNAPAGCFTTTVTDIGVLNWDPTTPFNEFCN